jgi:hypothetical protein
MIVNSKSVLSEGSGGRSRDARISNATTLGTKDGSDVRTTISSSSLSSSSEEEIMVEFRPLQEHDKNEIKELHEQW